MDGALLDVILGRIDSDSGLSEGASDLLLAACLGDRALAQAVAGEPPPRPQPLPQPQAGSDGEASPAGPGAYLASITVEGFRGIGPAQTLTLHPGRGLTVVAGRNGSGKSTFAEGLEVLLTGSIPRFESFAVFRDGWRNLHRKHPTRIQAEFHVEGAPGVATVERSWPDGGDLGDSTLTLTVTRPDGAARSLDDLGWRDHLSSHKPFLAHADLEAMFEGRPSELYDRLATVLGLGDLTAAQDRLASQRRELDGLVKSADAERKAIAHELATVDDERAATLRRLLTARDVDLDGVGLDGVGRLVTGTDGTAPGGLIDVLHRLAGLPGPDLEATEAAAERLHRAAAGLEAVAGTEAARARALADLLRTAIGLHDQRPDHTDCPVCGRAAALDAIWREQTIGEIARLDDEATAAERAHREASDAVRTGLALVTPVPDVLRDVSGGARGVGVDTTSLAHMWMAWTPPPEIRPDRPDELRVLAEHLARASDLAAPIDQVRKLAAEEVATREDRWSPVAERTAAWMAKWRAATDARPTVAHLKAAEKWLKAAHDDIRNERLRPIAERAQANWHELRHESNVELGAIRLAGSSTQRRVVLDATVDGSGSNALGVMSQGEVNALALSVFLPRATLPESPFRFVVIDDPVQAMDPAKVDGLARVLHDTARTHQVVVFTHDDRLPNALRRLDLAATIVQVQRRPGSIVEVSPAGDPASRALSDARVVARDGRVPQDVKRRVVPGQCRLALEAALSDIVIRREVAAGRPHHEVDELLGEARSLREKATLALVGVTESDADVVDRLAALDRRHASTYRQLNAGAHGEFAGSLDDLVRATGRLVDTLQETFT